MIDQVVGLAENLTPLALVGSGESERPPLLSPFSITIVSNNDLAKTDASSFVTNLPLPTPIS